MSRRACAIVTSTGGLSESSVRADDSWPPGGDPCSRPAAARVPRTRPATAAAPRDERAAVRQPPCRRPHSAPFGEERPRHETPKEPPRRAALEGGKWRAYRSRSATAGARSPRERAMGGCGRGGAPPFHPPIPAAPTSARPPTPRRVRKDGEAVLERAVGGLQPLARSAARVPRPTAAVSKRHGRGLARRESERPTVVPEGVAGPAQPGRRGGRAGYNRPLDPRRESLGPRQRSRSATAGGSLAARESGPWSWPWGS